MEHEITSEDVCNFIRHKWETEWRAKTDDNVRYLAQEIGVDIGNLHKILKNGVTWNITLPTINKFARYMKISTAKFFTEVEEQKKMT